LKNAQENLKNKGNFNNWRWRKYFYLKTTFLVYLKKKTIIFNMSIKDNYFDLILKYANKYKQPKHNTKYSNKYYLTHILDVLGDVVT
jgi:hypothetical protein